MDSRFKIIFEGITGSHLYGTNLPDSDTDIRGVFIPTEEFYLGFLEKVEQVESHTPDTVHWELSKFLQLCLDSNPNIIELLFIPPAFSTIRANEWNEILLHRDSFLSTKAQYTFSGYAMAQLHRIKNHREWLLNPPKAKPTRKEFGLPDTNTITKDQINAYDELINRGKVIELSVPVLEVLKREKAFINANTYWEKYQEWKTKRNPARAELEAKFGYDTKHASHLVRLLEEGKELLTTRNITFPRPNAQYLLSIRHGVYTYEELMHYIGDIDQHFNAIKDQFVVPRSPDRKQINDLCRCIIKRRIIA